MTYFTYKPINLFFIIIPAGDHNEEIHKLIRRQRDIIYSKDRASDQMFRVIGLL